MNIGDAASALKDLYAHGYRVGGHNGQADLAPALSALAADKDMLLMDPLANSPVSLTPAEFNKLHALVSHPETLTATDRDIHQQLADIAAHNVKLVAVSVAGAVAVTPAMAQVFLQMKDGAALLVPSGDRNAFFVDRRDRETFYAVDGDSSFTLQDSTWPLLRPGIVLNEAAFLKGGAQVSAALKAADMIASGAPTPKPPAFPNWMDASRFTLQNHGSELVSKPGQFCRRQYTMDLADPSGKVARLQIMEGEKIPRLALGRPGDTLSIAETPVAPNQATALYRGIKDLHWVVNDPEVYSACGNPPEEGADLLRAALRNLIVEDAVNN